MFNQVPPKIVQTNRLPFLIGLMVFLSVMAFFMYKTQHRNKQAPVTQNPPRQSIDVSPKGADNGWFNNDKFRKFKINYEAANHRPSLEEAQKHNLNKAETEDEYSTQLEIKKLKDKKLIEDTKMDMAAQNAPLNVEIPPPPDAPIASSGQRSGKNGLLDSLDHLKEAVASMGQAKWPAFDQLAAGLGGGINPQDGKSAFLKTSADKDDYLEHSKIKPRSGYEVKAGSSIPAALITGINSDLPGSVHAQVTENVYDSVTGNYLLIPQGAKLIGEYNSHVAFGQNRVQVVWNRIIFPDGQNLDLEKMQGTDMAGSTGFFDQVNNHYVRIYSSAILLSLIGAGYDILNQQQEQSTDARAAVAANVGQKLSDVSQQALEKNMNAQPTLIIRPGYQFKVMVLKDMVLENMNDAQGTLDYSE